MSTPNQSSMLSFLDVLRFAKGYWVKQPKKLSIILLMILTAALFEAYLPSALSSFLGAIREHNNNSIILYYLKIFIGIYLAQALLFSCAYIIYNIFETNIFKSLIDDAFSHVQRLPEQFFANTFTYRAVKLRPSGRRYKALLLDFILVFFAVRYTA